MTLSMNSASSMTGLKTVVKIDIVESNIHTFRIAMGDPLLCFYTVYKTVASTLTTFVRR